MKGMTQLLLMVLLMAVVGCGKGLDQNDSKSDAKIENQPINYSCQQACEHLWWCELINLESVDECKASCEAKSDRDRWLACVRDTPQCPADMACASNPSPTPADKPPTSSNCEKLCGLGYGCQMIPASGLQECKTECDKMMVALSATVKTCFESATTCEGLRKCNCNCDVDSTCTKGCHCDPECEEQTCTCTNPCPTGCEDFCKSSCTTTCTCNTTSHCDTFCDCDPDCKKLGEKCTDHNECGDQNYFPEKPKCVGTKCSRTCTHSALCPTNTSCTDIGFDEKVCVFNQ